MTKNEARDYYLSGQEFYIDNGKVIMRGRTVPINWYNEFIKEYGKPQVVENNYDVFYVLKYVKK